MCIFGLCASSLKTRVRKESNSRKFLLVRCLLLMLWLAQVPWASAVQNQPSTVLEALLSHLKKGGACFPCILQTERRHPRKLQTLSYQGWQLATA